MWCCFKMQSIISRVCDIPLQRWFYTANDCWSVVCALSISPFNICLSFPHQIFKWLNCFNCTPNEMYKRFSTPPTTNNNWWGCKYEWKKNTRTRTTAINTEHKHAKIVEHNLILVNAPTKFWLDKSFSASPKLVTVHFNFYIHSAMRSVDYWITNIANDIPFCRWTFI